MKYENDEKSRPVKKLKPRPPDKPFVVMVADTVEGPRKMGGFYDGEEGGLLDSIAGMVAQEFVREVHIYLPARD